jgi:hypothetical protein
MKYRFIDPFIQIISGILTTIASSALTSESWNMIYAMLAGGILGMFFMIILMIPLTALFGGFEIMIPLSMVTMACGMSGGMMGTLSNVTTTYAALIGAIIAFVVYGYVAIQDIKLKGLNHP